MSSGGVTQRIWRRSGLVGIEIAQYHCAIESVVDRVAVPFKLDLRFVGLLQSRYPYGNVHASHRSER